MNLEKLKEEHGLPNTSRPSQETLVQLGATALSLFRPWLSIVSVLASCAANANQQKRIDNFAKEIQETLNKHAEKLNDLTENQYKLILDSMGTALNTVNENKFKLLKGVIENTLEAAPKDFPKEQIDPVARIIRDISFEEAKLVCEYSTEIKIVPKYNMEPVEGQYSVDTRYVCMTDPEAEAFFGLVSLGLLAQRHSLAVAYEFTPLGKKVKTLLQDPMSHINETPSK